MNRQVSVVLLMILGFAGTACDRGKDEPDNTSRNKDYAETKTPLDQAQNASDLEITAAVRRAIVDDKNLSSNAKNCKVITEKGVVTLRGVVDNEAERKSIEATSKAAAGVVRVENQLEIKKP